jgi:membrane protease subunit (stomatin/prohibitin family)
MSQLMEVLYFIDESGKTMVKRIPEKGDGEIKWGAQLIVAESQNAIFFRDGKALDVFTAGRYMLETQNIPRITKWVTSFAYGPTSPFRADVYFLNMKLFPDLKWGTKEPIVFRDTEFQLVRVRSFGMFSIQINDPMLFLNKVVGTQKLFREEDIHDYLRGIIITRLTDVLGKKFKTILDLPKDFNQLSLLIKSSLDLDFEGLGLFLHDFYINSFSLPPEVQQMIDTKSGMAAIGNMDQFMKYKTAMAIEKAAGQPGGATATGVGVGAGLGMGFLMPHMIQGATQSVQSSSMETTLDKIKKLKELLETGAITKEEFEEKKRELLKVV